jgi:cytochrome oxidase Cu insertion factor (SCO1/SenC/PrrC family)
MKKLLIIALMSFLSINVKSQILEKTLQAVKKYKNISYDDVLKFQFSFQENAYIDTTHVQITQMPNELQVGGYFKLTNKTATQTFDGNKTIELNLGDSTYSISNDAVISQYSRNLLFWTKQLDKYLKTPSKIKSLTDTVINNIPYYHINVIVYDSVKNKEHIFDYVNLTIDKKTFLPYSIRDNSKGSDDAGTVLSMFEEHTFKNYQLNPAGFANLSVAAVPDYFKLPVRKIYTPLANGTKAPLINLYDLTGQRYQFENLKGKTVLLGFDFVGCPHCIDAEQTLKRLQEKYKDGNVVIAILYPIDSKEAVLKHNTNSKITTTSYTTERTVRNLYPYDGYPAFYVIDKNGNIAGNYLGYSNDLQDKLTAMIDAANK